MSQKKKRKSMRVQNKTRRQKTGIFIFHHFFLTSIIGIIILILLSFAVMKFMYHIQIKYPVVESPQTEMKKIPAQIKKKLRPVTTQYRVPILMYHYVEYVKDTRDTIRESLNIHPNIFENQIKTLNDAGYTFLTMSELADVLDNKIDLPTKPIILTFDDGHWDLATDVLPILKKYHAKATAYIVPGFLNGSDYLTEKQLREVLQSGLVEIAAHTVHHISLKDKLPSVVMDEVKKSKEMLENDYHIPVVSFAYPNGSFDEQAITAVKKAGFTTATSTIPGIEHDLAHRYFLYRLRPGGRTGEVFLKWLEQDHFSPW